MEEPLLRQFVETRDEQAFAGIIERFGPLVFGVCRRVLGQTQDAEDAAQAVFLTLAQKCSSLTSVASLEAWLHHVAWQVALDSRKRTLRRRKHEQEAAAMAQRKDSEHSAAEPQELSAWLDQEINGLPAKYRVPIILHHLRGHTQEQTAQQLNANPGTIATRLNRGRELLRDRLAQRGVVLSIGSLSALAPEAAQIPAAFVASTAKAASLLAAGHAASAGMLSAQTQILIKGALEMLILEKVKAVAAMALMLLLVGAAPLALRAWSADADTPAQTPAPTPALAAQAPLDNSLTLAGKVDAAKSGRAANVLGERGVLVVRSSERWKHLQERLTEFGWTKPAEDKNPLAKVDFSRQTIFGAFLYSNHGHSVNGLGCHIVRGTAKEVDIRFVLSYAVSMDAFAAPSFHFAFVAVPNAPKTNVSVASFQPARASATANTPETAQVEWSDTFDTQRGDWVNGLSATIVPEKSVISSGDDLRLEFTLTFSNAAAVQPSFFAQKLSSAFVWDGKYSHGYDNHAFLVERPDGKTVLVRVRPVGEWDKNAPHPVEITADQPYVLPSWAAGTTFKSLQVMMTEDGAKRDYGFKTDVPGVYKITGIYREDSSAHAERLRNIVRTMWGGDIASNTVNVEVK